MILSDHFYYTSSMDFIYFKRERDSCQSFISTFDIDVCTYRCSTCSDESMQVHSAGNIRVESP